MGNSEISGEIRALRYWYSETYTFPPSIEITVFQMFWRGEEHSIRKKKTKQETPSRKIERSNLDVLFKFPSVAFTYQTKCTLLGDTSWGKTGGKICKDYILKYATCLAVVFCCHCGAFLAGGLSYEAPLPVLTHKTYQQINHERASTLTVTVTLTLIQAKAKAPTRARLCLALWIIWWKKCGPTNTW